MNRYCIEIFWSDEDDGYIALVPDLPGCSAWGNTQEEALREIQNAVSAWIEACEKSGDPVPMPSRHAMRAAA